MEIRTEKYEGKSVKGGQTHMLLRVMRLGWPMDYGQYFDTFVAVADKKGLEFRSLGYSS